MNSEFPYYNPTQQKRTCKVKDVVDGEVFHYESLSGSSEFIKLHRDNKFNVVNTSTWSPGNIDENEVVDVVGVAKLKSY